MPEQDKEIKGGQKLKPGTLEPMELTEKDEAVISVALKTMDEIAKGLREVEIAEPTFFYLYHIDLMLNLLLCGHIKIFNNYLAAIQKIRKARKISFRERIMKHYKKTEDRDALLEALEDI